MLTTLARAVAFILLIILVLGLPNPQLNGTLSLEPRTLPLSSSPEPEPDCWENDQVDWMKTRVMNTKEEIKNFIKIRGLPEALTYQGRGDGSFSDVVLMDWWFQTRSFVTHPTVEAQQLYTPVYTAESLDVHKQKKEAAVWAKAWEMQDGEEGKSQEQIKAMRGDRSISFFVSVTIELWNLYVSQITAIMGSFDKGHFYTAIGETILGKQGLESFAFKSIMRTDVAGIVQTLLDNYPEYFKGLSIMQISLFHSSAPARTIEFVAQAQENCDDIQRNPDELFEFSEAKPLDENDLPDEIKHIRSVSCTNQGEDQPEFSEVQVLDKRGNRKRSFVIDQTSRTVYTDVYSSTPEPQDQIGEAGLCMEVWQKNSHSVSEQPVPSRIVFPIDTTSLMGVSYRSTTERAESTEDTDGRWMFSSFPGASYELWSTGIAKIALTMVQEYKDRFDKAGLQISRAALLVSENKNAVEAMEFSFSSKNT